MATFSPELQQVIEEAKSIAGVLQILMLEHLAATFTGDDQKRAHMLEEAKRVASELALRYANEGKVMSMGFATGMLENDAPFVEALALEKVVAPRLHKLPESAVMEFLDAVEDGRSAGMMRHYYG